MTQQQLDDSGGSSVPCPLLSPLPIRFVTNINYGRHVNIQPPIRRTLFRIITLEHVCGVAGWSLIYRTITDESQSRERSDNLADPPDVRDLK